MPYKATSHIYIKYLKNATETVTTFRARHLRPRLPTWPPSLAASAAEVSLESNLPVTAGAGCRVEKGEERREGEMRESIEEKGEERMKERRGERREERGDEKRRGEGRGEQ